MLGNAKTMCFSATARPQEALAFYGDALGLRLLEDTPFALVFDAGGRELRVQKVPELTPPPYTVLGWAVEDIGKMVQSLTARGVTFEVFDGLGQDSARIWTSPGGARIAWFCDPDGNILSLTQGG